MHTSILLFALTAMSTGADASSWQSNYRLAHEQSAREQKPMAVVFGNGATGWEQIARDGMLQSDAEQAFGSYICVYVDTATPEGQQLAKSFDIHGKGIVLSDRTGAVQAFWHEGDLSGAQLTRTLRQYANPEMAVRTTATVTPRVSYYPASAALTPVNGSTQPSGTVVLQPASGYDLLSPVSSCPTCNQGATFRRR